MTLTKEQNASNDANGSKRQRTCFAKEEPESHNHDRTLAVVQKILDQQSRDSAK